MSIRVSAITAAERYRVDIKSGEHVLVADEGPALGGADAGPAPFELVLAGLAACTAITLRMYAERKGWPDFRLSVQLELGLDHEKHLIRRKVEVQGAPDEAAIGRLRDIVERTPVTLAMKAGFDITTELDAGTVAA